MSDWPTVVAALGGIALGATVSGGLAWLMEESRRGHELRTHWLDVRRDLAVRFLDSTEDVFTLTNQLTLHMRADQGEPRLVAGNGPQTTQETMALIHEADVRVRALSTELDLVGSRPEREAANELRQAAWLAFSGSRIAGPDALPVEDIAAANADAVPAYYEARAQFQDAVRSGLVATDDK
jgi:hypothetical protein